MKKVLIINSPLFRDRNSLYDEDSLPPIGLGYIATALRKAGVEVELIDAVAEGLSIAELLEIATDRNPDYLAVNVFTTNLSLVKELVESLNKHHCAFIVGGLSTRTLQEKIFSWNTDSHIDVVFGDGEKIVPDIVLERLKELPVLDSVNRRFFSITSQSSYYVTDISDIPLDRSFFINEPIQHPLGLVEAHIVTSRGCIFNCAFCAAARSQNDGIRVRERTGLSVIQELQEITHLFPEVSSIRILDDLFLKNKGSITKAIEIFSGFSFSWRAMAHVMTLKGVESSLLLSLKKSGCHELFIGIESGSVDILKKIRKTHNVDTIKHRIVQLFRAGIAVKGYFIYGFPGETELDFQKTFELASYLKEQSVLHGAGFRTSVFQFRPYHGTELYHEICNVNLPSKIEPPLVPDKHLSNLVGRSQFNFHSGNYSVVELPIVHDYIYRTANLTPL
ncbi:MAG: radical SAM protein [Gallionella sp.]|nr:radical SAM protein [Gallionella sp.]MDD4959301.1 radical SAM protein [Gallionella sp.]